MGIPEQFMEHVHDFSLAEFNTSMDPTIFMMAASTLI